MAERQINTKAKDILAGHGLRNTRNRIQVLRLFLKHPEALTNQSIEEQLEQIDRITLYRTLKAFEEKGIIHQAIDGTNVNKYALCGTECDEGHHEDEHAHFHCISCGKTLCLESVDLSHFRLPEKYELHSAQLVMQGICKECKRNKR